MSSFTAAQTVGSVVAAAPSTSRVFERLGIDYCCGGKATLADACRGKGLPVEAVLADLAAAGAARPGERDWTGATAAEVVDHILDVHHTFVKRELPRLDALMEKVVRVHGAAHPGALPEMGRIWAGTSRELAMHLMKEEQILFPAVKALASGRSGGMPPAWLEGPMGVMEEEHVTAGADMAALRRLSGGYVPPADACGSWRALWSGLDEFEQDLHRHIHLENEVLFPKVRSLIGG